MLDVSNSNIQSIMTQISDVRDEQTATTVQDDVQLMDNSEESRY